MENVNNLNGGGENIPANIKKILVEAANHSVSYHTWKGHKSVLNLISQCERETGVSLKLPWTEAAHATFVGWNLKKKVRNSTLNTYISKVN